MQPFFQLIVVLVVIAIAWHFLKDYIDAPFQRLIVALVVIGVCLFILALAGIHIVPGI